MFGDGFRSASWSHSLAARAQLLEAFHGQVDDLFVVEREHVDQDPGQPDVLAGDDVLDLAHELGDGLGPDDPLGVLDGLEEEVDDPVVAELADGGHGRPADLVVGGAEDLRLDQLLDGLGPAEAAQAMTAGVLDAGVGVVELLDQDGIDVRHVSRSRGP